MHINKLQKPPAQYEYHDEKCPHCNGRLTMALYCYGCGSQWEKSDIESPCFDRNINLGGKNLRRASQPCDSSDPEIRCTCRQLAVGNAGGYPKGCPVHRPGG